MRVRRGTRDGYPIPERYALGSRAAQAIAAPESDVFVSAASVWEAGIKMQTGKLTVAGDLIQQVGRHGFAELPIRVEHGLAAARLPKHHHDPFDRMLVAQAQIERLTVVTRDSVFDRYTVPVLAA
jgi:PIN domain nuclease of toxin-antitoxin system